MVVDASKVRSVAPFRPPGGRGTPWPCTNCGQKHSSETSWVVRMSHDGDEWAIIVCETCAHVLDPAT